MNETSKNISAMAQNEIEDEKLISAAFQRLLDTYLASNHRKNVELIKRAYNFSKNAHKGVRRLSGEPYILHPIAVAQIVCQEMGLGSTSISAALLHDVEEDTDYTNKDLSNVFNPKVAQIVEGLTKIAGGKYAEKASLQAETMKKVVVSTADDIRIILIKIADRLHNMRTLSSMRPSKQYKIAAETLYIYAPLADRLGFNAIKTELEVLSFKYEHPQEYQKISNKLSEGVIAREKVFDAFTRPIYQALDARHIQYTIQQRVKSAYSIWKKMETKHLSYEDIYDIMAIRIVFEPSAQENEINECYNIYAELSKIYKSHPKRLRDWINHPKNNGYQALHATFMSNEGQWIEVQIRSKYMDEIAEQGLAAHWKYKDPNAPHDDTQFNDFMQKIKEILHDPNPNAIDNLDTLAPEFAPSELTIFSPKGDTYQLGLGATVLDFAFAVHSIIGSKCIGAKVNHKLVPINQPLQNGDQVDILTGSTTQIEPKWLDYVVTAKARTKIKTHLRGELRNKAQEGTLMLRDFLKKQDKELTPEVLNKLLALHQLPTTDELLAGIANKYIVLGKEDTNYLNGKKTKKWRDYFSFSYNNNDDKADRLTTQDDKNSIVSKLDRKKVLYLNETNLGACILSDCCHPIPGDDAVGYIDEKNQLIIHKRNCDTAIKIKSNHGDRLIAVDWDTHRKMTFPAKLYVKGIDDAGILFRISQMLFDELKLGVKRINMQSNDGIFEGNLLVNVYDTQDVKHACELLKTVSGVITAIRID